jgi:transcriptional regulator with XRE-family HTH domain
VAERLGVSAAAVTQWEKAEANGTITLKTLAKALGVFRMEPVILAAPQSPVRPAVWDTAIAHGLAPDPGGARKTILDARFRDRVPAIAGECLALGMPLTIPELWVMADHVSTGPSLDAWLQATAVRDGYDRMLRLIDQGRWTPVLALPDGRRVPAPDSPADPTGALSWAFTAIHNGAGWIEAIRAGAGLLIQHGYRWPVLPTRASFRDEWESALGVLRSVGNADRVARIVVDAMRGVLT